MTTRIITALITSAAWFTMLLKGSYLLCWGVMVIIGIICTYEYFSMVLKGPDRKFIFFATLCSILPLLFLYTPDMIHFNGGMVLGALSLLGLVLYSYKHSKDPFNLSLRLLFGLVYCGFLTGHIILILSLEQGSHWLFALTVITTFSDSGAYFIGKSMGRRKLCPHISPGKTIEGFIGGIGSATLGAVLVGLVLFPEIDPLKMALIAIPLSILGVCGDLSESIIKRATASKDSGRILPGHGGLLDRIDSLVFCAPPFYYILYFNLL